MNETLPRFNILIPLYNEQENIPLLRQRLSALMDLHSEKSISVIFVDDGSTDQTAAMLRGICEHDFRFQYVGLSRNFGHQKALSAGLSCVSATEAVMIMDGDLQDPPEMLNTFLDYLAQGYEVVYAVREKRQSGLIRRAVYHLFYVLLRRFAYVDIPLDSGDFALISRRVADHLIRMPEESRFLRGMRAWVGYNQIGIPYEREDRHHGHSKYSLKKLISLGLNGLFDFSKYPIRFTMVLGLLALTISVVYFLITLVRKIFVGDVPTGFTALLFTIILFGGLQLIAIGVIGEYILKIFFQVKQRPLYIIREKMINGIIETCPPQES